MSMDLCPHCKTRVNIRTSRELSDLTREKYFQCPNVFCGTTGKILSTVVHTIVPSLNPNPKVFLPQSRARDIPQDTRQLDLLQT